MGVYEAPILKDLGSVKDLTAAFGVADDADTIFDASGGEFGTATGSRDGEIREIRRT